MVAPAANEIEVTLWGPGYGECIVVHLGSGEWMIVDSCHGPDKRAVALSYLADLGVNVKKQVKLIVSTHWHDDHIRGLSELVLAAEGARLVVSGAIKEQQFLTLMNLLATSQALLSTGVDEWTKILDIIAKRRSGAIPGNAAPPILASADQRIYIRRAEANAGSSECEVWALSPSAEDFAAAREGFSILTNSVRGIPSRVEPIGPNHTSIVLWIKFGAAEVLLGADLQQAISPYAGWSAVVNSERRPISSAQIFKIPHHGSANGHNIEIWQKMLQEMPISMISPFVHGRTVLPTTDDIARIKGLSKGCYVTITPEIINTGRKKAKSIADRTMLRQAKNVRQVPQGTGRVRLRRAQHAPSWAVDTFGTAKQL